MATVDAALTQLFLADPRLERADLSLDRNDAWRVSLTLPIGAAGQTFVLHTPAFGDPVAAIDHARTKLLGKAQI